MANYYGTARTNYFDVKNLKEFAESMNRFDVEIIFKDKYYKDEELKEVLASEEPAQVGLYSTDPDSGTWPWIDDENPDGIYSPEEVDMSFYEIVAQYLTEDAVAIFQEVGSEKARYLVGYAIAIRHDRQTLDVSLNDIYEKVKNEWGKDPTLCEY